MLDITWQESFRTGMGDVLRRPSRGFGKPPGFALIAVAASSLIAWHFIRNDRHRRGDDHEAAARSD